METKTKVILTTLVLLLISAFSFLIYKFWTPISSFITGKSYLTAEEGQELYNKGLADGNKNETELKNKLNYYLELVEEIPTLEKEIELKNIKIENLNDEIQALTNEKDILLVKYQNLQTEHSQCEDIKAGLLSQIQNLNISISNKLDEIDSIQTEKIVLTTQISEKNLQIIKLKQDLSYYEQYIYTLTDSNTATVKFIFDENIHNIQAVTKNSTVMVSDPVSTTYVIFNYWTIDGTTRVELPEYLITENTTFIANVSKSYDVNFIVDSATIDSQIITEDSCANLPTTPTKDGYVFAGWTLDGVNLVDVANYQITSNTTFIAKFTRLNVVEFIFDGEIINSQFVKDGEFVDTSLLNTNYSDKYQFNYWTIDGVEVDLSSYAIVNEYTLVIANFTRLYDVNFIYEDIEYSRQLVLDTESAEMVTPENTPYKEFKGWSLDGVNVIDITNNPITENTTYFAIIEYSFDVKFMTDNEEFALQIIKSNEYATTPSNPTKTGFEFDGWTLNGTDIVDPSSIQITENTTFIAKFTQLFAVKFNYENSIVNTQIIRNGNYPTNYNVEDTDRIKFLGWSLDGSTIVDVTKIQITTDTTFIAVVTYFYKVDFIVNDEIISSMYVENGNYADYTGSIEVGDYDITGWTINGSSVTPSNYAITSDTTFTATLKRVRVTVTGNRATAYSVTDNWSSAGVYIIRFSVSELMSFTSANSADFVFTYGYLNGTTTYTGNSSGTVELSSDGKVGLSVSVDGGGISIYIYDEYYLDADFNVVLTPVYKGISGL